MELFIKLLLFVFIMLPDSILIRTCPLTDFENSIYSKLDECFSLIKSTPAEKINWEYYDIVFGKLKKEVEFYKECEGPFGDYFESHIESLEEELKEEVLGHFTCRDQFS
jgi:hypothetical protein